MLPVPVDPVVPRSIPIPHPEPSVDVQTIDARTCTDFFRSNSSMFNIPAGPALDAMLLNRGDSFTLTLTYDDKDQTVRKEDVHEQVVHLFKHRFRMNISKSLTVTKGSWNAIIEGLNAAVLASMLRIIEKAVDKTPPSFISPFVGALFGLAGFVIDWYYSPPPTAKGLATCTIAGATTAVFLGWVSKATQ